MKTISIQAAILKQVVDELNETNNFNLWKHHQLLYQQIKVKSRNLACYFLFFFFFYNQSVLKPMQWQKYSKCLIQPHFILHYKTINTISSFRSSCPKVFCEKGILRKFPKFPGKHLCQSLFLVKGILAQVSSCEFCEIFKYNFFHRTPLVAASTLCRNSFLFLLYNFF